MQTIDSHASQTAPSDAADQTDDAATEFAPRIGRYSILRKLGEGAMGVVYVGYDETLDRKLAIKLVKPQRSHGRQQQRMAREAQGLARLSHANVVQIYEVGEHEGGLYLAMEFVAGQTLRAWLAEQPRSWREIVAVFVRAGEGLAAAHAAGLIHRDFKSDNVVVQKDGSVKVLDFGLVREQHTANEENEENEESEEAEATEHPAQALDGKQPSPLQMDLTNTHALLGTPAYMAPEQFRGQLSDARSDQFSFCVALWEALYDERPFGGEAMGDRVLAAMHGRVREPPRAAKVPKWLRKVIERGLAPTPEQRWPSMPTLLEALGRDPGRRRVVIGGVAVLLLGVAGLLGHAQLQRVRTIEACEREGSSVANLWTVAERERARAAFEASGLSFALDSFAYVERELPLVLGRWARVRTDVCLAGELEHTRSPELLALSRECLDDHRVELAQLIERLVAADRADVEAAVSRVGNLAAIDDCTDDARLHARLRPPAEVEQQVRTLRERSGEVHDVDRAQQLLQAAEATQWLPLIAERRLALGRLHSEAGDYKLARTTLEQAFGEALRGGDDRRAAEIALALVSVVGVSLEDHDDALRWADIGTALADRTHPDSSRPDLLHARLLHATGLVHRRRRAFELALDHYQRALAVEQELLGSEHPSTAEIIGDIGVAYRQLGDDHTALTYYLRAQALIEANFGSAHPEIGPNLTNIGAIYRRRRDYPRALEYFDRALAIFSELGDDHPRVADVLSQIAAVHQAEQRYEDALELQLRILAIRERSYGSEDSRTADAHLNISLAAASAERYELAREHALLALAVYEHGDDVVRIAKAIGNAAANDAMLGHADASIAGWERILGLPELERHSAETLRRAQWQLAQLLADRDPARARALAESAAAGLEAAGNEQAATGIRVWLGH